MVLYVDYKHRKHYFTEKRNASASEILMATITLVL